MENELPRTRLGRTGREVSRLGYGAAFRREISPEQADRVLAVALDVGIDLIDTAASYGNSEELIGRALAPRRSAFVLATKCGCPPQDGPPASVWSPEGIRSSVETSLIRLRTDVIDILQLHNPPLDVISRDDLLHCLEGLRSVGKIRWIGVSTDTVELPALLESEAFDVIQLTYSALQAEAEPWLARVAATGAGVLVNGGVAQGEPGVGTGSDARWEAYHRARLDELKPVGESRTGFLLRHALGAVGAHSILVGSTDPGHIRENAISARKGALPPPLRQAIRTRLAGRDRPPPTPV